MLQKEWKLKLEKCVDNLHYKTEYVMHIRKLKQALNNRLIWKWLDRIMKFNQTAWVKPYIYWYERRSNKISKNDFEKYFFKLMNNSVFGKTMENVRKHRDIKLVTTGRRKSYLASELNIHTKQKIYWQQKWKKQKYLE